MISPRRAYDDELGEPVVMVDAETRAGLPCPRCLLPTREEVDVIHEGAIVATLEGCTTCGSGLHGVP